MVCVYIYICIYIYTYIYELNDFIWSNMDGPRDYHNKWSKSDKDKYHMISLMCGILQKNKQVDLFKK